MKTKTHALNVFLEPTQSSFFNLMIAKKTFSASFSKIINRMINLSKNENDLKDLEELADLQSEVKQIRLVEKLGKQGSQFDAKKLFEPITKEVKDTSQKLLEETKSTTKAIEKMDERIVHIKALELENKNGVVDSSFFKPIAKLLLPTNKQKPTSIIC